MFVGGQGWLIDMEIKSWSVWFNITGAVFVAFMYAYRGNFFFKTHGMVKFGLYN